MLEFFKKNYLVTFFVLATVILELFHFSIRNKPIVVQNPATVFGYFADNYTGIGTSIFVLIILLVFTRKHKELQPFFLVAASGAIVNAIDRFLYGGAIDYIKAPLIPIFNLPDVMIVLGLSGMVVKFLFNKKTPGKENFC